MIGIFPPPAGVGAGSAASTAAAGAGASFFWQPVRVETAAPRVKKTARDRSVRIVASSTPPDGIVRGQYECAAAMFEGPGIPRIPQESDAHGFAGRKPVRAGRYLFLIFATIPALRSATSEISYSIVAPSRIAASAPVRP